MTQSFQDALLAHVRARQRALAIRTFEESRALTMLEVAARRLGGSVLTWSCTQGWTSQGVSVDPRTGMLPLVPSDAPQNRKLSPVEAISQLEASRMEVRFAVFKDLPAWFNDAWVVRRFRDLLDAARPWVCVLIAPHFQFPASLEKEVAVLDLPLPEFAELRGLLLDQASALAGQLGRSVPVPDGLLDRLAQAAQGLTWNQAQLAFARAVQEDSRLDVADLEIIAEEKRLLIQRSGVLQYSSQAEGLDHVGGYRALKAWLAQRREGFSPAARQYGLSEPRGLFLLGVPGCGKSLSAKAIAQSWRLPLLHLDVGALFSKFIGETEANLRLALRTAEAAAPAVLWADEVEKGFAGASGAAHSDAGTSARMFATFLVWMQERARPVFVVATANNVSSLPPEFLRKGRFDEVFFLDLPALGEREEIVRIHLRKRARDPARFEVELLARESEGYSGAEIESAIVEAMYQGFTQKREFTTSDIREAIKKTVPLARTQLEAIQALRAWARDRARQAS